MPLTQLLADAIRGLRPDVSDAAKALEARGREAEAANIVTGAYLFDAERHESRVRALHIRERIRTLGPTVRQDLGKQAAGGGGGFPAVHS